jgi:N-acetylmuramoyl-L-alanine amidase
MPNTPQNIIVHHSVTPKDLPMGQTENSFNNNHKARGFPRSSLGWYIGYHYVIFGNGMLKQYRKDNETGAHCKEQSMNFRSLGICLAGNFDNEAPNPAQVNALQSFLHEKTKQYGIPKERIYPHRKFATYKSCYGSRLSDDWARNLINQSNQGESMELVWDNGTAFITGEKGKLGLVDPAMLAAIKSITDKERQGNTSNLPETGVIESMPVVRMKK